MGRIFVSIFSFYFLWSSAKYLPGGNASDLFFLVFRAKRFFGVVSLQSRARSSWPWAGFSRVFHPSLFCAWFGSFGCGVTHPIFGPVSAFLGVVFWLFWFFSRCGYSVPGLPGLF